MELMLSLELQRFEGVWTGTEDTRDGLNEYRSSAAFAHGVFRQDDRSKALTITWFRSQAATASQQANAVAEGDKPIFYETVGASTTRTTYIVVMDRLSVSTDRAVGNEWTRIFEGTYRQR
jgi:hypothetical protein